MAVIIVLTIVAAGSLPDSANAATAQSDAEASSGIVGLIMLLLYIPYTWITICLNAKRMHDCDNSGWMQLIPVYSFIVIGFFAGTTGPNRFGENPLSQK